jgi:transposase, IS30 family
MPGKRLSLVERAQLEVLFGQGLTYLEIGVAIGRHPTTVWRELKRNNAHTGARVEDGVFHPQRRPGGGYKAGVGYPKGREGVYRVKYSARAAQVRADERARRRRPYKLRLRRSRVWSPLGQRVRRKLAEKWSPKQIAQWLRAEYPEQPEMWVSHETIYQAVFYQARGGMRDELSRQIRLRSGRVGRISQSRLAAAGRSGKAWTRDFHISTRPAEVEDRAVPGHWEGDLIIGARGSSAIITLVERKTRYVMLGSLPRSRVSEEVIDVLITLMGRLPAELRKTLTWDQGAEMAQHARFSLTANCQVYFCDPHSPWQRGSNENTNGLLREYFPRSSTDFRKISQNELDTVARQLNGRPRQTLDWHNPAEALQRDLIATAA